MTLDPVLFHLNLTEFTQTGLNSHLSGAKSTSSHLDGVEESHESQAAEVHVQGVAQRPDEVVPGRVLAKMAHVHHGGSGRLTGGLTVGEWGAVGWEVVRVVVHDF